MSHIPIHKFVSINRNDMKASQGKITISNVIHSEPVKRLLNQPNIIVRTIPLKNATNTNFATGKILTIKKNGLKQNVPPPEKPEISIQAIRGNTIPLEETKHETLLPSKNSGKSEILIRPIYRKRKPCGHFEDCESLVCNVTFQNYADDSGVTPILARSISEDEINAPVTRHCKNPRCDALSIDHNRCRRACVKLYRFDRHNCCDICGVMLKTRKFRANHRGCKRKEIYQHNDVDSAEILRKKMRERELQILESAKMRKYDYLDSVHGHNRALEILRKNEELVVIPKMHMAPQQQPIVTITTLPTTTANAAKNVQVNATPTVKQFTVTGGTSGGNVTQTQKQGQTQSQMPTIKNVYGNVIGSIPIVIGNQTSVLLNTTKQNTTTVGTSSAPSNVVQNPVITVTTVPNPGGQGNTIRPVILSNWIGNNQSQVITTPLQPKPFITPIRVVPIANFKTQPSLLHQVQGMPKFCIMADTSNMQTILQPPPLVRIQPIQTSNGQQTIILPNVSRIVPKKPKEVEKPPPPPPKSPEVKVEEEEEEEEEDDDDKLGEGTMLDTIRRRRKKTQHKMLYRKSYIALEKERKKKPKVKNFSCPYCSKKLGTEWYFKTHVARHKGETPYVCRVCEKEFVNAYEMKKHHANKHNKHEMRCEFCPHVASCEKDLKEHLGAENETNPVKCWACGETATSCDKLDRHQRLSHGAEICRNCGERVSHVRLIKHLILRHGMPKTRAQGEAEKLSGSRAMVNYSEETQEADEVQVKQECNGEALIDEEITIKEEMEDVDDTDYYDYESYNFEEEVNPLALENEAEDTDTRVGEDYEEEDEEGRLVVDEGVQEEMEDEVEELNLVLEEEEMDDEEPDMDQFEEVIENGDEEEMEMEAAEEFGDDSSLCNACGKMFVNKRKYMEHRIYCANAAGTSDEGSNGYETIATMNGDKT